MTLPQILRNRGMHQIMKLSIAYKVILTIAVYLATWVVANADTKTDIKVAAPWEISSTDPATDGYIFLRMGIMETLVSTDANGALVPGLATQWSASDDGLSWNFTIREAIFHDGTQLTSDAAAAALNRAFALPGPLSKAPINSIESSSGDVVVTLDSPYSILPAVLAHSSAVIPAPASFDSEGKSTAAIGTGPFKVEKITLPQSMTSSRFDNYWGEPAKLTNASYLATKRAETRALMAESGDADLVFTLDPSGFKGLGQVDTVETVAVAIPRVMLLKVNTGNSKLSTPLRKALSMAIDREGIAAGIVRFPDAAATQLFPPALDQWHDSSLPALRYDVDAAKASLAELGWTPGDDGILTKDGERFTLTLRTFPDRPELPLVAAALQDQWKEIGIELEVSVSNFSEIPAGHQDGTLELALFARNYGATADPTGTVQVDFGAGGGDWGSMNWDAPQVADAVANIAANGEPSVRNPLIKSVVADIHNELPLIPVTWYQHTVSVAAGMEGVVIDPLERSYGLQSISWSK